ncbi:MAG: glutamate 5-kinase [Gammaproteobacteria bacterium]|nr:glutamate 5-kinase [Gammaproteobacteria bacterium]
MSSRSALVHSGRWVVKIGTTLLTDSRSGLNQSSIVSWVKQISLLKAQGLDVVLVSSGSVGEGMRRLGWDRRPNEVHHVQTAAAVGQMVLVQSYETAFSAQNVLTAQILLTHADLASRQRYLNARNTLRELLALGVVPIVNENDAVVNEEIRFGDNDTLAALAANLVEAECLVILTDRDGLFDRDPRSDRAAHLIRYASADDPKLMDSAGSPGKLGSGGMLTKIRAAQKASGSGAATAIVSGREENILVRLRNGEELGTFLAPGSNRITARKQWLAGQLRGTGMLVLDDGAVTVLRESGSSLLPIGVTSVEGSFTRGEIVICVDLNGSEIARGLINYNADETARIIGKSSTQIESILGYCGESELIHRDNIAITG